MSLKKENQKIEKQGYTLELNISDDKLHVSAIVLKEKNVEEEFPFTIEDVYELLKKNKIKYGIIDVNISELINEKIIATPVIVAEGIPAKDGRDAVIEYYFNVDKVPIIEEDEKGQVDFREIHKYESVQKGSLLARKIPATKGIDGKNVFGQKIPAKDGKDILLLAGKNTEYSEDHLSIYAVRTGIPVKQGYKIHVLEKLEVPEVSYKTGNIHFGGTIEVMKDVAPGFLIEAHNIIIRGHADNVDLKATGKIILHKGISGGKKHSVVARETIRSPFFEGYEIISDEDLIVEDYLLNCEVHVEGNIELTNPAKGYILGGKVVAGKSITAYILGSKMTGVKTKISAGISPKREKEYIELKKSIIQNRENLEKLEKNELYLKNLQYKMGKRFPKNKEKLLKKIQFAITRLKDFINDCEEKMEEIECYFKKSSPAQIIVKNRTYPNVEIEIGKLRYKINSILGPGVFKVDAEKNKIVFESKI